jgi:hypothetical protein
MDITEKAGKYAEGKANVAMTNAIAQAYADGYRDGYKDREEEIPVDLRDNKTEYVDLGLPSGTLWAKRFEKQNGERLYLPYDVAKRMNLPTEEQWEELQKVCKWSEEDEKIYCVGPNGNSLYFSTTGYIEARSKRVDNCSSYFWLTNSEANNEEKKVGRVLLWGNGALCQTLESFSGHKFPIRLVR